MTTREKIFGGAAVLLAICLGCGFVAWLHQHDARIVAEAQTKASRQTIAAAQKQIEALRADSASQAEELRKQLAGLEAQKQQPVTPVEFAAMLNALLPKQAPQVVVAQTPAQTEKGPQGTTATLPGAPVVQIPQADLQPLHDYGLNCQESAATAASCGKQLGNAQQELTQTDAQLKAKTQEAEQWKTAAKGGTWLGRLGRGLKCLALTGAGAAAGAAVDKAEPARGAALGAVAGGVTCRMW